MQTREVTKLDRKVTLQRGDSEDTPTVNTITINVNMCNCSCILCVRMAETKNERPKFHAAPRPTEVTLPIETNQNIATYLLN